VRRRRRVREKHTRMLMKFRCFLQRSLFCSSSLFAKNEAVTHRSA